MIGFFFVPPSDYLLALLVGSGAALVVPSRQSPLKSAFNLANYAFIAVVTLTVFRAIGQLQRAAGPARLAGGLRRDLPRGGHRRVHDRHGDRPVGRRAAVPEAARDDPVRRDWSRSPTRAWPCSPSRSCGSTRSRSGCWPCPLITLFVAYRAYVSEREKHERLELLYQSSRILQHSPELDRALVALLDHARDMFRAELAEVAPRVERGPRPGPPDDLDPGRPEPS